MWYKLTIGQQALFIVIMGWLPFCSVVNWLWRGGVDVVTGLFDPVQPTHLREENTGTRTYNTGNTKNTTTNASNAGGAVAKRQKALNKWGRDNCVTGLVEGEREAPPRAHFFGRLDGKKVIETDDYDLSYLNSFELAHWEKVLKRKDRKSRKKPDIQAKIEKITGLDDIDQLNLETAANLGILERKKGENAVIDIGDGLPETEFVYWDTASNSWFLDGNILILESEVITYWQCKEGKIGEIYKSTADKLRQRQQAHEEMANKLTAAVGQADDIDDTLELDMDEELDLTLDEEEVEARKNI